MKFLDIVKNFYPKCFVTELLSLEHVDCCFPLEIQSKASHMDVTLLWGKFLSSTLSTATSRNSLPYHIFAPLSFCL